MTIAATARDCKQVLPRSTRRAGQLPAAPDRKLGKVVINGPLLPSQLPPRPTKGRLQAAAR